MSVPNANSGEDTVYLLHASFTREIEYNGFAF